MGLYRTLAFSLIFLSFLLQAEIVDSIVAKVGKQIFTYSDILQESALLNIENNIPFNSKPNKFLKKKILDGLIFRAFLIKQANLLNISVPYEEIDKKMVQYMQLKNIDKFIKKFEISDLEFRFIIKKRLIADTMLKHYFKSKYKNKNLSLKQKKELAKKWFNSLKKQQTIIFYKIP